MKELDQVVLKSLAHEGKSPRSCSRFSLLLAAALLLCATTEAIASYSEMVLSHAPAAYWRFGESSGNVALDSSPNGRHATYSGPLLGQSGAIIGDGNSAVFFGYYEADMIQRADSTGLMPGYGSWAVEAWIKVGWSGRAMDIVSWYPGGSAWGHDSYYMLGVTSEGLPSYMLRDAYGSTANAIGAASITDDSWHHLVGVLDRQQSKVILYVDGVEVKSASTGTLGLILDNGFPVNIGRQYRFWTSDYKQYEGKVDEVALYSSALTPGDVRLHFDAGRGLLSDGDSDGVWDAFDTCPGSAAGVAVDAAGCEIKVCLAQEQLDQAVLDAVAGKELLIASKESTIAELNREVNALLATAAAKDALINQQEYTIATLTAALEAKDRSIAALTADIVAKDRIIADANARISTMYTQAQLDKMIADAVAAAQQGMVGSISAELSASFGTPGFVLPGATITEQVNNLSRAIGDLPKGQIDKLQQLLTR